VGSSNFTPEQLSENIEAVVQGLTDKFISKGWRNIKALHVKGANTMAMPIWLASELWVEETDVVEAVENGKTDGQNKKRKQIEEGDQKLLEGGNKKSRKQKKADDDDEASSLAARKQKLEKQKAQALEDGEAAAVKVSSGPAKKKKKSLS
jgi:ribosome biogenesis protein UTP30